MDSQIFQRWGNNVWTGIRDLYCLDYLHQGKALGTCVGWFALPEPYSKAEAKRRYDGRQPMVAIPAIFSTLDPRFPDADRQVVSLIQLLEGGKPWPISASRVFNTVPLVMR
jgi:hypothetical protein